MTLYQGSRTTVEINRKSGRVRVWSAATGKLIEEFFIRVLTPEQPAREEETT